MTMSSKERQQQQHQNQIQQQQQEDMMEWSAEEEIQLFFALEGLKPVGVNKHFYMACIAERLSKSLNRDIPAEYIWAHLRTMYNLDVLDEMEPIPFPNEQKDFYLPDTPEFTTLIQRKKSEQINNSIDEQSNTNTNNKKDHKVTNTADNNKDKSSPLIGKQTIQQKDNIDNKKVVVKLISTDIQQSTGGTTTTPTATTNKRNTQKRTRGSMCLDTTNNSSPSTTPPPTQNNKRRRI